MVGVAQALSKRRSIRKFLPKKVTRALLEEILQSASRAPSGSNMQPWKVYVVMGSKKDELLRSIGEQIAQGKRGEKTEFNICPPNLKEKYMTRRRESGKAMYESLGIERNDHEKREEHHDKNWRFFDAPVGMIFTMDRQMEHAQFGDLGIFMQSLMLAAEEKGLGTCPQLTWAHWPRLVPRILEIPEDEMVVAGMALGYADESDPVNQMQTSRLPLSEFVRFCDEEPRQD